MATKALKARLGALEATYGIDEVPQEPIFVKVCDASIPDPANPHPAAEYSDATIVGYRTHRSGVAAVVARQEGEAITALEARAAATHSDVVLFFAMYDDGVLH